MSRIVATQGGGRYLIDLETEVDGKPQGQIVDTRRGRIFPPQFIGSILARGYWHPCEISPEDQAAILALGTARPGVGGSGTSPPMLAWAAPEGQPEASRD